MEKQFTYQKLLIAYNKLLVEDELLRLAAAGLGKNSPAGEKFSSKICRKIKFVVSLTNLKKKVAAGNLLR